MVPINFSVTLPLLEYLLRDNSIFIFLKEVLLKLQFYSYVKILNQSSSKNFSYYSLS
jgi:hypothetical protein